MKCRTFGCEGEIEIDRRGRSLPYCPVCDRAYPRSSVDDVPPPLPDDVEHDYPRSSAERADA